MIRDRFAEAAAERHVAFWPGVEIKVDDERALLDGGRR
jgi:hypothetical protein